MDAVRQNGIALRYVSAELKADRSIVMAAVKQFGWALAYAPSELADREIIMLAVAQCGSALQFASDENELMWWRQPLHRTVTHCDMRPLDCGQDHMYVPYHRVKDTHRTVLNIHTYNHI